MRSFLPLFLVLLLLPLSQALHFYLDANEQKCFMEELPMDTIVEGPFTPSPRSLARPVALSLTALPLLLMSVRPLHCT